MNPFLLLVTADLVMIAGPAGIICWRNGVFKRIKLPSFKRKRTTALVQQTAAFTELTTWKHNRRAEDALLWKKQWDDLLGTTEIVKSLDYWEQRHLQSRIEQIRMTKRPVAIPRTQSVTAKRLIDNTRVTVLTSRIVSGKRDHDGNVYYWLDTDDVLVVEKPMVMVV